MKYGLIGNPVRHSFSPELHRMIGGYDYDLLRLDRGDLGEFFQKRDFDGINVTVPYKEAVIPYLDELDASASAVGAVNTVVRRGNKLIGSNTDVGGMAALLQDMGAPVRGSKVLILGTGGAAKASYGAAVQLGASEVVFVSRSKQPGAVTYEEASKLHGDASIIINATPCGMFPDLDGCPVDLSPFPALRSVADAIYNPLSPRLVLEARRRSVSARGGLYMLVAQAVLASELFTGESIDRNVTDKVYHALLHDKRNIVLVGMPGCGKTSVGREVARLMGREFFDLDEQVAHRAGKSIADIFLGDGEAAFRALETQLIREIAPRNGLVIATGGGAVLHPLNIDLFRHNGWLFFLDRAVGQLVPTEDRPLSDTEEKLSLLYRQRLPIYRSVSDEIIPAAASIRETAEDIIGRFTEVLDL